VVALQANGKVWAWGNNEQGQLGTGNRRSHLSPVAATAVNSYVSKHGVKVKQLAAGGNKAYALLSNGRVIAWGGNEYGDLGAGTTGGQSLTPVVVSRLPSNIVAISSGNLFGDALTSTGAVYDWGYNAHGQLGNGTRRNSSVAVRVTHLTDGRSRQVVKISAGGDLPANGHNMALLSDGTVMTWGDNADGQLGNGKTASSTVPVIVTRLSDGRSSHAVSIGAGGSHSMALLSDGTVMTWGDNRDGQLGDGRTVKSTVPVRALTGCEMISAGANDSLAARRPKR
jgi:alpha-tubulin suppressor-like RCC1 family protein